MFVLCTPEHTLTNLLISVGKVDEPENDLNATSPVQFLIVFKPAPDMVSASSLTPAKEGKEEP